MILVFGQTGQVAQELQRLAPDAALLGRNRVDLRDPGAAAKAIREAKPEAVINAAAYTAVDKAEEEEALAQTVNGDAPAAMAKACCDLGIPLIHISTDYVFDGSGDAPFKPTDPTGPLGAYGRTKLAGEEAIRATGGPFAILRTSWVFSAHGGNFVKTMLRLSESRDRLTIVADQIGGPTPAKAIAEACLTIAQELQRAPEKSGVYHFSGSPDVSWSGFAREIFARTGRDVTVEDIPTTDYPTPAKRPLNSRLDCSDLAVFGLNRPDWRSGLNEVLIELEAV
ncbi:dTDP-4-dehydrorhamnose reductase [Thioclava sediminum]|uniref:dTDP-4-dehydrorhamnose reductase n=1 Tax=Thioclava sediminum TaxID=1915319 RepID=A0ABX3MUM1_9RHOB|nr:dTDP-4-dehydrorhamnose reductase [Thioclava sediminum]OOY22989.1 dTDP-4-dehydrorhamnose reductase [Thioclava sediminum]